MGRKYTRKCNHCKNKYIGFGGKFCSKECSNKHNAPKLSEDRKGRGNPMYGEKPWNYRGGRKHKIDDYKIVGRNSNGSRIFKHRRVAEKNLGRKLKDNEVVHHIDGDINNNDISNLEVMSRSEHTRLHFRLYLRELEKNQGGGSYDQGK